MKKLTKVFGILFVIGLLFSCADGSSSSSSNKDKDDTNSNSEDITIINGTELTHQQCIFNAPIFFKLVPKQNYDYKNCYNYSSFEKYESRYIYFIQFKNNIEFKYDIVASLYDNETKYKSVEEVLNTYKVPEEEVRKYYFEDFESIIKEAEEKEQYITNYFKNPTEETAKELLNSYDRDSISCLYKITKLDIDNAEITFDFSNLVLAFDNTFEKKCVYNVILYLSDTKSSDITFTEPATKNTNFYENSSFELNNNKIQKRENSVSPINYEIYVSQNYK